MIYWSAKSGSENIGCSHTENINPQSTNRVRIKLLTSNFLYFTRQDKIIYIYTRNKISNQSEVQVLVLTGSKNKTMQRSQNAWCVCVCVSGGEGSWVFTSTTINSYFCTRFPLCHHSN